MGYRQVILIRKDLNMGKGKACAQASHASMAFLTWMIRNNISRIDDNKYSAWNPSYVITGKKKPQYYRRTDLNAWAEDARNQGKDYFYANPVDPSYPYDELELCEEPKYHYKTSFNVDNDLYEQWINGSYTKTVCEAKNKNHLLKAITIAENLGLKEGVDFFCIRDNCLTELEPEEVDENGVGRTLTAIGFRPLPDDVAHQISKKYQLYK